MAAANWCIYLKKRLSPNTSFKRCWRNINNRWRPPYHRFAFRKITDPEALGSYLDNLVGVVEHGLFLNMVSMVIVGYEDGPKTLHVPAR